MHTRIPCCLLAALLLGGLTVSTKAQVSIPDPALNAVLRDTLGKPTGPLTEQDMLGLTNLTAISRNITNLQGLGAARNLNVLILDDNRITNGLLADELASLTRLTELDLTENPFTQLSLPAGLTNLARLRSENGKLTQLTLPPGLTKLTELYLGSNQLTSFTVPADMTNLMFLRLNDNQLTNFTLPASLEHLSFLHLPGNQLRSLPLPAALTNLSALVLTGNPLTNLTLPPDMTQLSQFLVEGNSLTTLVVSEALAATGLASVVDSLRNQGVSVFTYPLTVQLVRPRVLLGAFQFGLTGPPGNYSVFGSSELAAWDVLATVRNPLGSIGVTFTEPTALSAPRKFYRALLQTPPTNMVFIAPNTFTMGSPASDFDHSIFEGPQSTVTLTRGFWIAKYEVTQGEYLAVMGVNPSNFPGDLSRPVSSVSWHDATNYCAKLTQRERAAGRIAPGSFYRLPTEAEWECAARAGTSTRFAYGDDTQYASLTNYAWFLDLARIDLTVHSVGQKLPNAWGLYDMAGNVWEWCQDWYGEQVGGVQIDPTGPASNPNGNKVMRGGAYDYPNSSCRSASRLFFFALFPDSDLGFRVVLEP